MQTLYWALSYILPTIKHYLGCNGGLQTTRGPISRSKGPHRLYAQEESCGENQAQRYPPSSLAQDPGHTGRGYIFCTTLPGARPTPLAALGLFLGAYVPVQAPPLRIGNIESITVMKLSYIVTWGCWVNIYPCTQQDSGMYTMTTGFSALNSVVSSGRPGPRPLQVS